MERPSAFWGEDLATEVPAANRVYARCLAMDTTPFHISIWKAPNHSHLRTFGGNCCYTLPTSQMAKIYPCSAPHTILGYSPHVKWCHLCDATAHGKVTARSVSLHEPPSSTAFFFSLRASPFSTVPESTLVSGVLFFPF